jgi:hypothetical protein
LRFHDNLYPGAELIVQLVVTLGNRSGDNERGTGVVNQHRVHLVHDRVIVLPLNQVLGRDGHVVAQIVETELVVRTKGNSELYALRRASELGSCLSMQSTDKPWNMYMGPIHSESRLAR